MCRLDRNSVLPILSSLERHVIMSNQEIDPDLFKPRMPEVDFPPKLEDIFEKARKAAAVDTTPTQGKNRHGSLSRPGAWSCSILAPLPVR